MRTAPKVLHVLPTLESIGGGITSFVAGLKIENDRVGATNYFYTGAGQSVEASIWAGPHVRPLLRVGPSVPNFTPGLSDAIRSISPNVIHAHGLWLYQSAFLAFSDLDSSTVKVISTHGLLNPGAFLNKSHWKKALWMKIVEQRNLDTADCLHVMTKTEAQLARKAGVSVPIAVIPNAVALPIAPPLEQVSSPSRPRILLYLGQLNRGKGIMELIDAWAVLKRTNSLSTGWILRIVGHGDHDYTRRIFGSVSLKGVTESVIFSGPLFGAEKDAAFRSASAFVLPSFSEGMPTVVLESWAFGVPCAITDTCNFQEAFTAGAAFELRHSSLESDLGRFLNSLYIIGPSLRARGLELVRNNYNYRVVNERLKQLYQWLGGLGKQPSFVET
jgi:glycosyltransferase involved in cell wall biosynthesis